MMDDVCRDEGQHRGVSDREDTTLTKREIVSNRNVQSSPSLRTTSSADSPFDAQQENGMKKVSTFRAEDYGEAPPPLAANWKSASLFWIPKRARGAGGPQEDAEDEPSMRWSLRMSLGIQYISAFLSLNAFYALRWFGRSMYVLPVLALGLNFIIGYLFCLLGSSGIKHGGDKLTWYFNGTAADAFAIFIYVGGFALSLTAILFSLCIVAFQVASVTYSSRMLTGLTTRRSTKMVVSIFLGTFAYTFAGILSTQTVEDDPFVPSVAVNVLVLYVIATVLGLVYYLHYVVRSLRISKLMDDVALETERAMARFHAPLDKSVDRKRRKRRWMGKRYEADLSSSQDLSGKLPDVPKGADKIHADENGYLIGVSETALVRMAQKWDFGIRILPRPGTYITKGTQIAWIWFYRQESHVRTSCGFLSSLILSCFKFGKDRSTQDDVKFGLQQITDVAVRALSPAVNDPNTAIEAIHRQHRLLSQIATLRCAPRVICSTDASKRVLLVIPLPNFKNLFSSVILPLIYYGVTDVQVARKLQFVLANIGYALLRQLASAGNECCRAELESRIALVENHMKILLKMARKKHEQHDCDAIKYATKKALATLKKGRDEFLETQANTSLASSAELELWENAGPAAHENVEDTCQAEGIGDSDSFVDFE
ncbi:Uncharacterized protein FVE85_6959 [Porphyridium purpureum]|uniref:Uncharacterized protein n=1 Tax=Porphyridium purpureum TaxID=35688 RepID=A0A5J4Z8Q9_PORPP|nr:Uncharacterized protein FVE85_6959 [Porphyridium purpureum]|eukprot:POR1149..scf295_1